jgi:hypothetical protein
MWPTLSHPKETAKLIKEAATSVVAEVATLARPIDSLQFA